MILFTILFMIMSFSLNWFLYPIALITSVGSFSNITDQQSSLSALPHLLLGLLEALRDKVHLLESGDQTLLVAGGARIKHLHTGLVRQGMLPAPRRTWPCS